MLNKATSSVLGREASSRTQVRFRLRQGFGGQAGGFALSGLAGGLSCAIRADQPSDLTQSDLQVVVVNGAQATEGVRHLSNPKV